MTGLQHRLTLQHSFDCINCIPNAQGQHWGHWYKPCGQTAGRAPSVQAHPCLLDGRLRSVHLLGSWAGLLTRQNCPGTSGDTCPLCLSPPTNIPAAFVGEVAVGV